MPQKLKYSIIMFLAGSSYGIVVPLVRTAHHKGFSTTDVMLTQYLIAALALLLIVLAFFRRRVQLKDALKLMGVGISAAAVSFFYYQSLERLSAATSLTLLFQFVWMGMVVQAVRTRTLPKPAAFFTVIFVVIGAVLATGMLDEGVSSANLDLLGVLFGLASAVFYTTFLILSGKVATDLPPFNRTLFTVMGSVIIAFTLAVPSYFDKPMLIVEPWVSLALGLGGICLPLFLISISAPQLPAGLTTVMASSELPSGVICAALFLGEPVSFTMGLGVVIILVGIVLSELESLRSNWQRTKKNGQESEDSLS